MIDRAVIQPRDPLEMARVLWPKVKFYNKQIDVIYSVRDDDETIVPAGNMLGKDFVSAFIVLWFFLTRQPCRIVTTSVKADHLRVLWGEIARFIHTASKPLLAPQGPLIFNHLELRKIFNRQVDGFSYVKGMVAKEGAAMQGHHVDSTDGIPRSLFLVDEASGVPDVYYTMAATWAKRILIIGNPWPCNNFFRRNVREGNLVSEDGRRRYRTVIRIRATDSPNVRFGKIRASIHGDVNESILPGVLTYDEYVKRVSTWDDIRKTVSLDAEFPEGAETLMFPPQWLNAAEEYAEGKILGPAISMGIDSAQGGDNTCWAVCALDGLKELISKKTPDTSVIVGETIALMKKYQLDPANVVFDAGGGGKQHADRIRVLGYKVRVVGFGESATRPMQRASHSFTVKVDESEKRYVYKNRRAQMYHQLRLLLDPSEPGNFGLPSALVNARRLDGGASLREQMAPIELWFDEEGTIYMPPKNKRPDLSVNTSKPCLTEIIGCSPDEADALVLATHAFLCKPEIRRIGAMFQKTK